MGQKPVFFFRPWRLVDARIEMVVPPLAALLPNPSVEMLGNQSPFLGAVTVHKLHHQVVLLRETKKRLLVYQSTVLNKEVSKPFLLIEKKNKKV